MVDGHTSLHSTEKKDIPVTSTHCSGHYSTQPPPPPPQSFAVINQQQELQQRAVIKTLVRSVIPRILFHFFLHLFALSRAGRRSR